MGDQASGLARYPVIHIEGVFDGVTGLALRTRVAAGSARPTVLDFSRAREVSDLALVVLARTLAKEGIAARLRGLSHHHERMLRYIGLGLVTASHRASALAEGALGA
jgi:anti-anti-sigma regulatory factor